MPISTTPCRGAMLANFYSAGRSAPTARGSSCTQRSSAFLEPPRRRAPSGCRSATRSTPQTHVGRADLARSTCSKVLGYIERGQAEGARLLCGGGRVEQGASTAASSSSRRSSTAARDDMRDRARGDLRAGDGGAVLQRRGRGRRAAPTPRNTASPPASSPATSRARTASSPGCRPAPAGSTTTT